MVGRMFRFMAERDGNFATIAAVAAVPLFLFVGLSVDVTRSLNSRSAAQEAVDAATLSVVRLQSLSDTELTEKAQEFFLGNFEESGSIADLEVQAKNLGGGIVHVTVSGELDTNFMQIGGFPVMRFSASAKAEIGSGSSNPQARCMHALNTSKSSALIYNNKRGPLLYAGDSIIAPDCTVQVNSAASGALFVKEDQGYQFARHCIVGSVSGPVSALTPAPDPACKTAIGDPLAARALPVAPACLSGGMSSSGSTVTFNPGNYCGGISANSGTIVFNPGVYHITGGDLDIEASENITGEGVTFVMHPGSGGISILSDKQLHLKAPTSGAMAGFLVFDRNGQARDHVLKTVQNDTSLMELEGVIYAPEDHAEIFWRRAGTGAYEKPLHFRAFSVIADTIDLHGYNQLYIEAADLGTLIPELSEGSGTGNLVRLIE